MPSLDFALSGDPDPVGPVGSMVVDRGLGAPVKVVYEIGVPHGGIEEARLAAQFERRDLLIRGDLTPSSRPVRASWDAAFRTLAVTAFATRMPVAFTSERRRRVHHATTARELLAGFASGVRPIRAMANALQALKFPQSRGAVLVQDGETDNACLRGHVLPEIARLEPRTERRAWVITGSLNESENTAGGMVLAWLTAAAYQRTGCLDAKLVRLPAGEGNVRLEFTDDTTRPAILPPYDAVVVRRTWSGRGFTSEAWRAWIARDLPLFLDTGGDPLPVVRVVDRLVQTAQDRITWTTVLETVPADAQWLPPEAAVHGWFGCGVVETSRPTEVLFTARLAGFEAGGANSDRVDARVGAAGTGADGRSGLVLVPAAGRTVRLRHSGRVDEAVDHEGEVRLDAPVLPAPAVDFGDGFQFHFGNVKGSVEDVHVNSHIKVAVEGNSQLSATGEVVTEGGGTRTAHRGGVFHMGG